MLTDIHGKSGNFKKIAAALEKADYVLLAGDITDFGNQTDAERIIMEIEKYNRNIIAVPGNCDYPDVDDFLLSRGYSAERKIVKTAPEIFTVMGLGGSLPAPSETPYTFSEINYTSFLERADTADIVLSHQPPYNTHADRVMGIRHVGCRSLKKYIDKYNPLLCLCGHIHESSGKSVSSGTLIVNPGPFFKGYYSEITIDTQRTVHAEIHKIT